MVKTIQNKTNYDLVTNSSKAFATFKEEFPRTKIDFRKFKEIINAINIFYLEYILNTGDIVFIPYGLGKVFIQKNKRRIRRSKDGTGTHVIAPVNWAETKKQGKVIYYMNEHSDEFTYRYWWFHKSAHLKHFPNWEMKMSDYAKKRLFAKIVDKEVDYRRNYSELKSMRANQYIKKQVKKETNGG